MHRPGDVLPALCIQMALHISLFHQFCINSQPPHDLEREHVAKTRQWDSGVSAASLWQCLSVGAGPGAELGMPPSSSEQCAVTPQEPR